jgi:hypothetical protein
MARTTATRPRRYVSSPIFAAIKSGDQPRVAELLTANPGLASAVDDRDPASDQSTPLHVAAAVGHVGIATLLLNAGADVNALDEDADIPLTFAVANHHTPMVVFLIARGARVCHRNPVQENVIDAALGVMEEEERYGHEEITPQIRALCATCPHCP